jgi:hypothetical protein
MRMSFFDPHRGEVAATATDLITRFGLRAHDEASHLAQLSAQMHSRWHRVLYELVAREIDASFVEAQTRLGLRQSASGTARLASPLREGCEDGGAGAEARQPERDVIPRMANNRQAPSVRPASGQRESFSTPTPSILLLRLNNEQADVNV